MALFCGTGAASIAQIHCCHCMTLSPYPGVTRVAAGYRIIISITTYRAVENPIIASTGSKTFEYLAEYLEYLAEYLEYLDEYLVTPKVPRMVGTNY